VVLIQTLHDSIRDKSLSAMPWLILSLICSANYNATN
jgi:hypothetical protein